MWLFLVDVMPSFSLGSINLIKILSKKIYTNRNYVLLYYSSVNCDPNLLKLEKKKSFLQFSFFYKTLLATTFLLQIYLLLYNWKTSLKLIALHRKFIAKIFSLFGVMFFFVFQLGEQNERIGREASEIVQ